VDNVTKRFGAIDAIKGVSIELKQGEIVGLIGPNGSGKSTLFNLIMGLIKPDRGKIIFNNKDITGLKPHRICKYGIVKTFQTPTPFSNMTVLDNVLVSASFNTLDSSQKISHLDNHERAIELLKFINLYDKKDILAKNLTLMDKKKLELARALATQPKLLLIDEIMAGAAPHMISNILSLLRKINSEMKVTLFIIEHVISALMNIASRIIVLNYGEKLAEGTPEEIVNNSSVLKVYLGEG